MSEQFSISVPFTSSGVLMLRAAAAQLASLVGGVAAGTVAPAAPAAPVEAPAKGKPGRKSNAEKAAAAAAAAAPAAPQGATAGTADDLDLGMNDDEQTDGESDELGLGDTPPPAPALTLAGDVIPAFRAALDRLGGDKSKLAKFLDGYGVKSVQALPEAKFAEVVQKLAKLK